MGETPKLKPCPFCGGEASIVKEHDSDDFGKFYAVKCHTCRAKGGEHFTNDECPLFFEGVRNSWNQRNQPNE